MSLIADIENKLAQMNPAQFQELGDLILTRKFPDATIFACVGSQFGKEKTTPGTPDTYIEEANQAIYVEYSTNVSRGLHKIKEDIEKCLADIAERRVSTKATIVICTNFRIAIDNQIALVQYVELKGCKCFVYDGQYIARLIVSDYKDIAQLYRLGADTGQVIGIDVFLKEYECRGGQFAIPLSTKFMLRSDELAQISKNLNSCDIVLITGAPGIGKTRIAIEAIKEFCKTNGFHSKCISYKEDSLLCDLNYNLINGRDYVILVDDVNKIKHIRQILAFQNSYREGKIKLILTVRSHAKNEVVDILADSQHEIVKIAPMSNEGVVELIKSNWDISNSEYLEKIAAIACGNPRLAMMAATVAVKEHNSSCLSNLGIMFDTFYSGLFNCYHAHENELLYKSFAIAAVLGPFTMENAQIPFICSVFNVSREDFSKAIDRWVEVEYIDKYSNGFYKIVEQNMGPYMFYYIIRKWPELIKSIFGICFGKQSAICENIISCIHLFGLSCMREHVSPYMSKFFISLQRDEDKIAFLKHYWLLIVDNTIDFIATSIYSIELPKEISRDYKVEYKTNEFAYSSDRDSLLDLISGIFDYPIDELGAIIQLAIEYIRRKPELCPQLVWSINEHFGFNLDDSQKGFMRQAILVDIISAGLGAGDNLSKYLFWEIITVLLKCEHNYTTGVFRFPHVFRIYDLSVRENLPLTILHERIWSLIDIYFDKICFDSFVGRHVFLGPENSIYPKLDAELAVKIIEKHFSQSNFEDCLIVHEFTGRIKHISGCQSLVLSLTNKFSSDNYRFYNNLRWNCCNGKEETDYDYKSYGQLKTKELLSLFHFDTKEECDDFICALRGIINSDKVHEKEQLFRSVSFVIGHVLQANTCLGKYFLKRVLDFAADSELNIDYMILPIMIDENHDCTESFYAIKDNLYSTDNRYRYSLLINYYRVLPSRYLKMEDLGLLLKCVRDYNSLDTMLIYPSCYTKFNEIAYNGFTLFMKELYLYNINEFKFYLSSYETEAWTELITDDDLAELIYLQQVKHQGHFDYKRKAFFNMVNKRPRFLVDYVTVAKPHSSPKINEIWSVVDIEPVIGEILSKITPLSFSNRGLSQDWEDELFSDIKNAENAKKAEKFIIRSFEQKNNLKQTFRLARIFSRELFNRLAVEYIDIAASAEEYMEIDWINACSVSVVVNQDIDEFVAKRWEDLLSVVYTSQSPKKYPIVAKIKLFIQADKDYCRSVAEHEKLFI